MGYFLTTVDVIETQIPVHGARTAENHRVHRKPHGGPKTDWVLSTKYTDSETGLVYYGYRFYMPEIGRWMSRDPFGERGGVNLLVITENDLINHVDYLGLDLWPPDPVDLGNLIADWLNSHGYTDPPVPPWTTDEDNPECPSGTISQPVLEIQREKYYDVQLRTWTLRTWTYLFYIERLKIIRRGCCCGGTVSASITETKSISSRDWGVEWFGIWQSVREVKTRTIETPCRLRPL